MSSASIRASSSPRAAAHTTFNAGVSPAPGPSTIRTRRSSVYLSTIVRVASVEASSSTTSSKSSKVCRRMLSTASATKGSALRAGMTTLTRGSRDTRYPPDLAPLDRDVVCAQPGRVQLGGERLLGVLHFVRRVQELWQAELCTQRHQPIAVGHRYADEDPVGRRLGGERLLGVLHFVRRVQELWQAELCTQRHQPIAVGHRYADEDPVGRRLGDDSS